MRLIPAGKDYLWGGRRLKEEFGKISDLNPLAESWECSTHPDGMSQVQTADGIFTLRELLLVHPDWLGTHPARSMPDAAARGEIPILVKFIDAQKDLSVQVHPDDDYAREHENGQLGKSEMWYVLDAAEGAQLVYGFSHTVSKEVLLRTIRSDRLESCLQKVPVHRDDVFFVKAGTVHAIGAGTLIVEVQENSNLTYRLYDYHRKGPDGRERELHIRKALEAMDCSACAAPRQPMRVLRYRRGYAAELLCRCRYFQVGRILINSAALEENASERNALKKSASEKNAPKKSASEMHAAAKSAPEKNAQDKNVPDKKAAEKSASEKGALEDRTGIHYSTDETSFHVLICIEGRGSARSEGTELSLRQGDSLFLPASSAPLRLNGTMTLLDINC